MKSIKRLASHYSHYTTHLLVIVIITLIILLISKGYPQPYCDDMYVIGAALNMVQGNGFENPYVSIWTDTFPTSKPFYFPPGFSYMLVGWLMVFGTGVGSMLAFQWLSLVIGAGSLTLLLRRWCGQELSVSLIGGLAFLLAFQLEGFRNEVTAYALAFLGLCICFYSDRILKFLGYFLIAFSGVVYPTAPIIAIPVYLAVFRLNFSQDSVPFRNSWKAILHELPYALVAFCISFSVFLWMIQGDLSEFIRVFIINKESSIPGTFWDQVKGYWYHSTVSNQKFIRLPLLVTSIIAFMYSLMISIRQKKLYWILPSCFLICCLISILTNPMRARTFAPIFQIIVVMIVLGQAFHKAAFLHTASGVLFCVLINLKTLLSVATQLPVDQDKLAKVKSEIANLDYTKTRVIIDCWSARYIYSYNIPPRVTDLNAWASVPKIHAKGKAVVRLLEPLTRPSNEIWLMDAEGYRSSVNTTGSTKIPIPERATFLGKKINNITLEQADCILIR